MVNGDSGCLLCIEIVDGTPLAVSNHFRRIDGAWRMVHHQSSPIAGLATTAGDVPPSPGQRLH